MADLNGETFVLTGKTGNLSRQAARDAIQRNNGYVNDGMPDYNHIVVVKDLNSRPPNTQKFATAKSKGCRMISDQQMVDILAGRITLSVALGAQPQGPVPAATAAATAPAEPKRPKRDVTSLIQPSTGTYTVGF